MESIIGSLGRVPRLRTTVYGTAPEERRRAAFLAGASHSTPIHLVATP
jgi:hypothetical protein